MKLNRTALIAALAGITLLAPTAAVATPITTEGLIVKTPFARTNERTEGIVPAPFPRTNERTQVVNPFARTNDGRLLSLI